MRRPSIRLFGPRIVQLPAHQEVQLLCRRLLLRTFHRHVRPPFQRIHRALVQRRCRHRTPLAPQLLDQQGNQRLSHHHRRHPILQIHRVTGPPSGLHHPHHQIRPTPQLLDPRSSLRRHRHYIQLIHQALDPLLNLHHRLHPVQLLHPRRRPSTSQQQAPRQFLQPQFLRGFRRLSICQQHLPVLQQDSPLLQRRYHLQVFPLRCPLLSLQHLRRQIQPLHQVPDPLSSPRHHRR
mmetsp:Transcript_11247/g.23032  ORF Transcript_11247/g.23032 Transcript_11247/m.23032 type:complete len:235 (-) Transcript_11247:599-1303(-)